jgi:hypothetical protein
MTPGQVEALADEAQAKDQVLGFRASEFSDDEGSDTPWKDCDATQFDDASCDPGAFDLEVGQSHFLPCQFLSPGPIVRIGHHVSRPRASPLSRQRGSVTDGSSPKNASAGGFSMANIDN